MNLPLEFKLKKIELETGYLLEKEYPYYADYTRVFGGDYGFYDEEHEFGVMEVDFLRLVKMARKRMRSGLDDSYAVLHYEESHDKNSVLFSTMKRDGVIFEHFINGNNEIVIMPDISTEDLVWECKARNVGYPPSDEEMFQALQFEHFRDDAEEHLHNYFDNLDGDEILEAVKPEGLTNYAWGDLTEWLAKQFEKHKDCNIADNVVWDSLIRNITKPAWK